MKTIAMYLPQFHEIEENSKWWGEGYTEWVAVKNAVPYFDGHKQPIKPQKDNYYDLSKHETMLWQAELLTKYDIDGLCFYHYYFEHGKKIIEKPAENLLKWKDVNIPFCFCWANPSWARTWSKINCATGWSEKYEKKGSNIETGILLAQDYGEEKDWKIHFKYLEQFFLDSRYIYVDGKPLILIYAPDAICNLKYMLDCWRKLSIEAGLNGIYVIGINDERDRRGLDATMKHAPGMFFRESNSKNGVKVYGYDRIWNDILKQKNGLSHKRYYEGFVNYDDTPRRGKKGNVVEGFSVEKFENYFYQLLLKNYKNGNEITFINAWNEWAEGMHLEPDDENELKILEVIKHAKDKFEVDKDKIKIGKEKTEILDKEIIEKCQDTWLSLVDKNRKLDDYLKKMGLNKIAIYGIGRLGKHLIRQLENTGILIEYVIDKRSDVNENIKLLSLNDTLPLVDGIIITVLNDNNTIADELEKRVNCRIYYLDEILNGALSEVRW